jgi:hypothetical protein
VVEAPGARGGGERLGGGGVSEELKAVAWVRQRADADLRAREILEDRRGDPELFAERADLGEDGLVLRRATVREVEPGHVHPALKECPERHPGRGGRADRANDLRPPLEAGDVAHLSPARRW